MESVAAHFFWSQKYRTPRLSKRIKQKYTDEKEIITCKARLRHAPAKKKKWLMVSLDTKAKRKHGQYTRPEINGCLRLSDAGDRRGCRRRGDSKGPSHVTWYMILKQFALTTHLFHLRAHCILYFIADVITQTVCYRRLTCCHRHLLWVMMVMECISLFIYPRFILSNPIPKHVVLASHQSHI